jgi:hypothetical protein
MHQGGPVPGGGRGDCPTEPGIVGFVGLAQPNPAAPHATEKPYAAREGVSARPATGTGPPLSRDAPTYADLTGRT